MASFNRVFYKLITFVQQIVVVILNDSIDYPVFWNNCNIAIPSRVNKEQLNAWPTAVHGHSAPVSSKLE